MRALIADDQPDVIEALRLLLKQDGYQTEAVNSPGAVLERLTDREFDVLLMDLNYTRDTTSGQEGLDLLARIRHLDGSLPVVVMTAWGNIPLAVEAMRRGARDFVQKPWDNCELLSTVRRQVGVSTAQKAELGDAAATQQALLPRIPQVPGCDISASWTPVREVGGDYLDFIPLDRRRLALAVGDVSGKGVSAALIMSNVQAAVRSLAPETAAPEDLVARLNAVLCANTAANKFVTLFYALLDGRHLAYTNAGHNAPMLVNANGRARRLDSGGALLGVFRDWIFQREELDLSPGDRLLLFSDGITEAENPSGEQFGEERLLALVTRHRALDSTRLRKKILAEVAGFTGGSFQDDATLVVIGIE